MIHCLEVDSLAIIIQAIFAVPWPSTIASPLLQRSGLAHRGVALLRVPPSALKRQEQERLEAKKNPVATFPVAEDGPLEYAVPPSVCEGNQAGREVTATRLRGGLEKNRVGSRAFLP